MIRKSVVYLFWVFVNLPRRPRLQGRRGLNIFVIRAGCGSPKPWMHTGIAANVPLRLFIKTMNLDLLDYFLAFYIKLTIIFIVYDKTIIAARAV